MKHKSSDRLLNELYNSENENKGRRGGKYLTFFLENEEWE